LAYDRDGNEIEQKNIKKYKKENIVWKFPPEYAHIIGVPFKTFKGGGAGTHPPQKPKTIIKSLPERKDLEIVFPNVVGYRSESEMGRIVADYTNEPKFKLNLTQIREETILSTPVGEDIVVLKKDYRDLRDSQVIYVLTQRLIQQYYTDHEKGREFQLFGQLKRIVEQWYDTQIDLIGGDGSKEMRRLSLFWNPKEVSTAIYEGIRRANTDSEKIKAILNYYNPNSSTSHVFGATSKEVYPTTKSHVNYVVADTTSWEQIAAKTLEELPQVVSYVKNHFLNFKIPYLDVATEHAYVPDFIAKIQTESGKEVYLILEISGFSNDRYGHKDLKRKYAQDFWLPAVNNLGKYGTWEYLEVTDIDNIKAILIDKINSL
jgi:type III restriction enzyme